MKSQTQCVPSLLAQRRRRRRFPERALLERVRNYEDLLRQNKITFEPLHKDSIEVNTSIRAEESEDGSDEGRDATVGVHSSNNPTTAKSDGGYEAKYALYENIDGN